jgi:hypothetical protein
VVAEKRRNVNQDLASLRGLRRPSVLEAASMLDLWTSELICALVFVVRG